MWILYSKQNPAKIKDDINSHGKALLRHIYPAYSTFGFNIYKGSPDINLSKGTAKSIYHTLSCIEQNKI